MNVYTRKIDREYNRILMEGADTEGDAEGNIKFKIQPHRIALAKDYLVMAMHGMTQKEIDELPSDEFDKLLDEAEKARKPDPLA